MYHANYPNDFGLFNMAGNVNEWTTRCISSYEQKPFGDDLNTYRGNDLYEKV
jgi:sulfatase modifying factor 1